MSKDGETVCFHGVSFLECPLCRGLKLGKQLSEECNSIALAESLLEYIKANPSLRFWQALRNWAGVNFIFAAQFIQLSDGKPVDAINTLYSEQRNPLKSNVG